MKVSQLREAASYYTQEQFVYIQGLNISGMTIEVLDELQSNLILLDGYHDVKNTQFIENCNKVIQLRRKRIKDDKQHSLEERKLDLSWFDVKTKHQITLVQIFLVLLAGVLVAVQEYFKFNRPTYLAIPKEGTLETLSPKLDIQKEGGYSGSFIALVVIVAAIFIFLSCWCDRIGKTKMKQD